MNEELMRIQYRNALFRGSQVIKVDVLRHESSERRVQERLIGKKEIPSRL